MTFKPKIDITKIAEPSWLKEVAPDSCMNLKDIADIFKVNPHTMRGKITRGEFPKPDITHLVGKALGNIDTFCNKGLWRTSTVRKFFKQQGEQHENTNGKELTTNS